MPCSNVGGCGDGCALVVVVVSSHHCQYLDILLEKNRKKRNKNLLVAERCQHLTSLGPYLFAGGGDMELGPSSSLLVVVVRVKEVV